MKYKKTIIFSISTLLIILTILFFIYDIIRFSNNPASDDDSKLIFYVKSGQGFNSITTGLHESRFISNINKFKLFARYHKLEKMVKAGEYLLSPSMSPVEILDILVNGKVNLHKYTIPEGYNLKQIAKVFGTINPEMESKILELSMAHETALKYDVPIDNLEGYLFPDTYLLPESPDPDVIIHAMVSRFNKEFTPEWKDRAQKIGLSVHEVVTLASLIEKETGVPEEYKLISSVCHNRLKKNMRLQIDPTVIYGIKDFDGDIKEKHLKMRTPYNTYKIKGLPIGPIASPGRQALEAALYPADTNYLYFVAKRDSTHQFSTNLRDHNRAVRKYQLRRK